jgi:hypothetical protein
VKFNWQIVAVFILAFAAFVFEVWRDSRRAS